jgi:hypothetical protein
VLVNICELLQDTENAQLLRGKITTDNILLLEKGKVVFIDQLERDEHINLLMNPAESKEACDIQSLVNLVICMCSLEKPDSV